MTKDLINRITYHLSSGGLFNPELADHLAVRNLLMECREALAQPEQEPVAWVSSEELLVMRGNALGGAKDWRINVGLVKQDGDVGLYTTPPQRTWVNMTADEVDQGLLKTNYVMKTAEAWRHGVEWAQFNLMRKNT